MTEQLITRPEDLRPGDIFLGPIGGLVGLGVGLGQLVLGEAWRTGKLSIRHAGIIVGNTGGLPSLAQAMPRGAEIVPIELTKHWTERCAYVRLPEDYPGQAADAAAVARLMVRERVGYSFLTYPALAALKLGIPAPGLHRWVDRRQLEHLVPHRGSGETRLPVRAICSRFVDFAWTAAGKKVLEGTRPGVATPGMLADQLSYYAGATWCRPRGVDIAARSWIV